ncbi:hypothetical protein PBI_KEPLER_53 [Arthrobacter phage Kepler]|uniref:Uncharacterized protein n=1 Tax=Arthrobacter phage Kepler TaxID=2419959 RepID=A0A3G2KH42_9CAUD|nr:hypothetical protein HOU55_gp53 [Arthrobacter phage Kepler]AYN58280.1 hypothetical protein PBI_KEPLER_53 [Arthrobacter phage Kepler]
MSGEEKKAGFEVPEDTTALVIFKKPEMVGDLGIGLEASVRAVTTVPPWLLVSALRQLADTLEMEYGDKCGCGEIHG